MRIKFNFIKYIKLILNPKCLYWGIIFLILYSFIFGKTGFIKLYNLWQEGRHLERQIALEKEYNEFLKNEIDSLSDPINLSRIELEARKNGMAAPDEIVIKVR